jgi:DNA processing protein
LRDLPAFLDPADPRPATARALRRWLDLQHALALRPQEAVAALAHGTDPARALVRAGGTPLDARQLDASVATLRRLGGLALPWTSPAYPEAARQLSDAAPLLLVRGDARLLAQPALAVVGSRAASAYGRAVARRFAGELAAAGLVIVSGLATGIDAVAHRAALEVGGATVAVQACGLDVVYPARHRRLAESIARSGAIVTEFPPGTPPRPGFFPLRNRLISAFSAAVLVVEARERSGSLVTASHAANQGVDVWAVPGPLGSPTSAGTNRLLYDGAYVAISPAVIVEKLRFHGVLPPARAPARRAATRARSATSPRAEGDGLIAALLHRPMSRDELARALACTPQQLAPELLELELAGAVAEDRDGRLRVVSPEKVPGL